MPAAQKSAPKWRLTALVCKHLGPHLPPTIRGQHKNAPNGGVGGTKRGAKWWGARGIRKEGKGDPKAMCGWGGEGRGGVASTGSLWRRARARGPRALWVEGGAGGWGRARMMARTALPWQRNLNPAIPAPSGAPRCYLCGSGALLSGGVCAATVRCRRTLDAVISTDLRSRPRSGGPRRLSPRFAVTATRTG